MNKFLTVSFLLTIFCVGTALAQERNCFELKKLIDTTYNFKPSKLTEDQKNDKSAKMDAIWSKVKANPKELLPCLREEINSRTNDGFFRFDASNLLIQIDRSAESKKILIKSYAAVDLNDVNLQYWMPYIATLGYEGFDTSAAGENWLKHPNPEYFLPQHGPLSVNKEIGALIIYGSMDESIAMPALVKIASQEKHPAREIAVNLLIQQATPESFQALKKLDQKGLSENTRQTVNSLLTKPKLLTAREGEPKVTRQKYLEVFQQFVEGKPQAFLRLATEDPNSDRDAVAVMKPEDIPLIRKVRRAFISNANPHSAEWYKAFTEILMALVWKPELIEQKKL